MFCFVCFFIGKTDDDGSGRPSLDNVALHGSPLDATARQKKQKRVANTERKKERRKKTEKKTTDGDVQREKDEQTNEGVKGRRGREIKAKI